MSLSNLILNNKYQLNHRVGSGSYGVVYSARHLYTGVEFAVKVIPKRERLMPNYKAECSKKLILELETRLGTIGLNSHGQLPANLLDLDLISTHGTRCKILKEISLQLAVHKHPNILSIYKVYDSEYALFVVMDYYPEGDLFGTIVDKRRYQNDPLLVKRVFVQLVDAITYCQSKGIFHCDLKPENILVAENGTKLILADFGLSVRDEVVESNVCCGSSYYMAPERIQNLADCYDSNDQRCHIDRLNEYHAHHRSNVKFPTIAGDVWSLCIILINLISIRNPWLKASVKDTTFRAYLEDPTVLMRILPLSQEIYDILRKYLRLNPYERHSLFELRHDIISARQLSQTGPLSKVCDPVRDDDEAYLCQVPVDHVAANRERSEEEAVCGPESHHLSIEAQQIVDRYHNEEDVSDDEELTGSASSTPGTSVSEYPTPKTYLEYLNAQLCPPVTWK